MYEGIYNPTFDGNGNLTALVEATTGILAAAYEYDAYGNTVRISGTYATENPIRFSTKYHDNETGLVYYGYRFYSPSMGRFLTRDPLTEDGGLNIYAMTSNNPVGRWDYLGLDDHEDYGCGCGDPVDDDDNSEESANSKAADKYENQLFEEGMNWFPWQPAPRHEPVDVAGALIPAISLTGTSVNSFGMGSVSLTDEFSMLNYSPAAGSQGGAFNLPGWLADSMEMSSLLGGTPNSIPSQAINIQNISLSDLSKTPLTKPPKLLIGPNGQDPTNPNNYDPNSKVPDTRTGSAASTSKTIGNILNSTTSDATAPASQGSSASPIKLNATGSVGYQMNSNLTMQVGGNFTFSYLANGVFHGTYGSLVNIGATASVGAAFNMGSFKSTFSASYTSAAGHGKNSVALNISGNWSW